MEMVYFEGGDTGVEAGGESSITGVPEELQVLFWGDRDALMRQLLDVEADNTAVAEALTEQICLIDRQRAYYTKYIEADGIAIMGHYRVPDAHFYNAREVILIMTSKRPELRGPLTPHHNKFRMVLFVMNDYGFPTMPEYPNGYRTPGWCVWTSCQSGVFQDASGFPPGMLGGYKVLVHEFGHAIHAAIQQLDPTFQARLESAYAVASADAIEAWDPGPDRYTKHDHAMTNPSEYWAEGVARWFGEVGSSKTRYYHDAFLKLDPLLYALLEAWLPSIDFREVELPNMDKEL